MKVAVLILLMAVSAQAQTNTNTAPIFISFTNSTGDFITNAEVTKVLPNKLYYEIPSGGGCVRLDALPAAERAQFNYDPYAANQADTDEALKKKREQQYLADVAAQKALEMGKAECAQSRKTVSGKVIQKIEEGLLVDSGREALDEVGVTTSHYYANGDASGGTTDAVFEGTKPGATCLGLVLLEDDPDYDQIVDDNLVQAIAYPDGQFTYTTANNSSKTIRRFTMDFNKAFDYWKSHNK
jgi:hypothetical protein